MKLFNQLLSLLVILSFSVSAWALDLKTARAQGLVEELPTGYIKAKDSKAAALEKSVNAKRKNAYEKIAKKAKISVDAVGAQAHKKIMKGMKDGK